MTKIGDASTGNEPYIAGADHCNAHAATPSQIGENCQISHANTLRTSIIVSGQCSAGDSQLDPVPSSALIVAQPSTIRGAEHTRIVGSFSILESPWCPEIVRGPKHRKS